MRRNDFGDGDLCPADPEHGHMIFTKDRRGQYCPHQSHDRSGQPAHYEYDGKTPRSKRG